MTGLTYKATTVSHYLLDLFRLHSVDLGLEQVLYGDQTTIPKSPTACVEPGEVTREVVGVPMVTDNTMRIGVIIYSSSLDGIEVAQKNGDQCAEDVADFLNLQAQPPTLYTSGNLLGGLITAGNVEGIVSGYAVKQKTLMRANRIIFVGYSHTHLVLDGEGVKHT